MARPFRTPTQPIGAAHATDRLGGESAALEHLLKRCRSEVSQVSRKVEPAPVSAEPAKRQAVNVRYRNDELAAGRQQVPGFAQHWHRLVDLLQRMPHRNQIE